jgi:NTP pyrophosphatase (non-canonical NTP hydrolase)
MPKYSYVVLRFIEDASGKDVRVSEMYEHLGDLAQDIEEKGLFPGPRDFYRKELEDRGAQGYRRTFSLHVLQEELKTWVLHNFGDRPSWQPLLGIGEEIGELAAAATDEEVADAIADTAVYVADYANVMGWDIQKIWDNRGFARPLDDDLTKILGKLNHHHLKAEQGIRGDRDDHHGRISWNLGALLSVLAGRAGGAQKFLDIVERTWNEVKQRDWKKNAADGSNGSEILDEVGEIVGEILTPNFEVGDGVIVRANAYRSAEIAEIVESQGRGIHVVCTRTGKQYVVESKDLELLDDDSLRRNGVSGTDREETEAAAGVYTAAQIPTGEGGPHGG